MIAAIDALASEKINQSPLESAAFKLSGFSSGFDFRSIKLPTPRIQFFNILSAPSSLVRKVTLMIGNDPPSPTRSEYISILLSPFALTLTSLLASIFPIPFVCSSGFEWVIPPPKPISYRRPFPLLIYSHDENDSHSFREDKYK